MSSKYATTTNGSYNENMRYDITMCVIASKGLSSRIALFECAFSL